KFDVPPGTPGWADIHVQTPDGTSTLPKSLFYAASVKDYPSADSFTAVLFDAGRNQLYLSAGDHIDVFSLVSNQFLTPITPPAQGASKQFAGLALSLDGSLLLATDLLDGSLGAINPDTPSNSYVALGGGGFCIYDALQKTLSGLDTYQLYGAAISGDGNVAASQWVFIDSAAHNIGRMARPDIYYGAYSQDVSSNFFLLQEPKL